MDTWGACPDANRVDILNDWFSGTVHAEVDFPLGLNHLLQVIVEHAVGYSGNIGYHFTVA